MENFKKQIYEDIEEYQNRFPHMVGLKKPEWAFNFWILDKFFSIDEELIEEHIVDYNDKGIDCYVWHEDSGDLYLIQNKFYDDNSVITNSYVQNDFLSRPIGALTKGTYTRSPELQRIFSANCDREEFTIYYYLYVTNDKKSSEVESGIQKFNDNNKKSIAKVFYLEDIEKLYYGEPIKEKKTFKFTLQTKNKGTVINMDTKNYGMNLVIDAKYAVVPVYLLYEMYKKSKEKEYPLFEENIREFLGVSGAVNKKIMETLKDPKDRVNFFYYNNGITIIAEDIGKISSQSRKGNSEIEVINPQIVNGCQTVSTIYETLASLPVGSLEKEFEDTFVMVKILKIPSMDGEMETLYKSIVTYNNSQNAINQKTFVANTSELVRIQTEFERKGFLLCIKQSDKYQFKRKYPKPSVLLGRNSDLIDKFGLEGKSKTNDFFIDLEKLLQVVIAFNKSTQDAIQKKATLLKAGSANNKNVMEFVTNNKVTINALLALYLLYLRAEKERKESDDGKTPNPFYVINCFSYYDCKGDPEKILELLKTKSDINRITTLYKGSFKMYLKDTGGDYNTTIKLPLERDIMSKVVETAKVML